MPLGLEIKTVRNEICGVDNLQAKYDGFTTSFLPWHDNGLGPETPNGETALLFDDRHYILNGNWMLAYSELAPLGYEACFAFFCRKYPQFGSSWSDRPE